MKFLVDENLGASTVALLTAAGHLAERVVGGADDVHVLKRAIASQAIYPAGQTERGPLFGD